ncbi:hypothetical protein BFX06_00555 [Sulfobacillus thermosulfidooxidans]|nr:hypothetical protein BFX05_06960 [Sulfobacillus thermosulfidooxidans]OLZ18688.1 hypothetical protein BFX06_00555 [Sulfobacillus thermosulfidooxidans]OLZ20233.1 hypothetical protein BFX07_01245 [Sulfobacillus thermosulfidooxidans]
MFPGRLKLSFGRVTIDLGQFILYTFDFEMDQLVSKKIESSLKKNQFLLLSVSYARIDTTDDEDS